MWTNVDKAFSLFRLLTLFIQMINSVPFTHTDGQAQQAHINWAVYKGPVMLLHLWIFPALTGQSWCLFLNKQLSKENKYTHKCQTIPLK